MPSSQEKFTSINILWSRMQPIIICDYEAKRKEFEALKSDLGEFIKAEEPNSPGELFTLLSENRTAAIIFSPDILRKRKNYIDILYGAVCSSTDSSNLGKVQLDGQKSFVFKGQILILTTLTREEIAKSDKLKNIDRDCLKM